MYFCSLKRPGNNDKPREPSWDNSKDGSSLKEPEHLGKMSNSRSRSGNIQNESETFCQKVRKL